MRDWKPEVIARENLNVANGRSLFTVSIFIWEHFVKIDDSKSLEGDQFSLYPGPTVITEWGKQMKWVNDCEAAIPRDEVKDWNRNAPRIAFLKAQ